MKNKKGFKVLNIIMKIISWCVMTILIVIGLALLSVVVLNKIAEVKGEPSPVGLYTIISPSMTPNIAVYDVVVVVKKDPAKIKEGDIVSYYSSNSMLGDIPVTHRVVEKFNTNTGYTFRTKGDANAVVDNEIVYEENVIGTVRFVIPQLGRIQFFLATKGGWFIAILIPAVGIIIYDIIKLTKLIRVKNKMQYVHELSQQEDMPDEKIEKKLEEKRESFEEELRKYHEEQREFEREQEEYKKKENKKKTDLKTDNRPKSKKRSK